MLPAGPEGTGSTVDGFAHPTVATKEAKGRVRLTGAVDRPKELAVPLLSLKRSSAESGIFAEQVGVIKGHVHQASLDIPEKVSVAEPGVAT